MSSVSRNKINRDESQRKSILTWLRGNRDPEGGSLRTRPDHCTTIGLTPAIGTNVADSGV